MIKEKLKYTAPKHSL